MSFIKNDDAPPNEDVSAGSSSKNDFPARTRWLLMIIFSFSAAASMYLWGAENAVADMKDLIRNNNESIPSLRAPSIPAPTQSAKAVINSGAAPETLPPSVEPAITSDRLLFKLTAETITIKTDHKTPETSPQTAEPKPPYVGTCSDMCTKREAKRKQKYGGNLLDFSDVLRMAEAGHKKVQTQLRKDYGEYFDKMFINGTNPDGGTSYYGMRPPDGDGPSRERMKRKLKIKVLKMMASLKATEKNVYGCDCLEMSGSVKGDVDEDTLTELPEFYEKYVFANGGHSTAAGHGNMFSEAYTAVLGRDLRPVWEAIGIEMVDRNYAQGGMGANPMVTLCMKEWFGVDVDLLAWNYGMTDGNPKSAGHYVYRGALIPSRPAIVFVSANFRSMPLWKMFEEVGLAMFQSKIEGVPVKELPDMTPEGIPISDQDAMKIPEFARYAKCNGRLEGKDLCFQNKWSCTPAMQDAGMDCICPNVGKRTGWHSGYRMHALEGHLIALPVIEMMLEALRELAAEESTDADQLLATLKKEEDADFKMFMESPLLDLVTDGFYDSLGKPTDELFEIWFRGNSICRPAYVPTQARFLGIMTESDKTGDVAIYSHETYETGIMWTAFSDDGNFTFQDEEPPPGKISIIASIGQRSGWGNIEEYEKSCPAIVMPDYKDMFYGPLLNGKTSFTFPNKKEMRHYGYDPKKFKGIIVMVLPPYTGKCKGCEHTFDLLPDDYGTNFTMTVNSQPVRSIKVVSEKAMILIGNGGSPYFAPDPKTNDYTLEWTVHPQATQYWVRYGNFILM